MVKQSKMYFSVSFLLRILVLCSTTNSCNDLADFNLKINNTYMLRTPCKKDITLVLRIEIKCTCCDQDETSGWKSQAINKFLYSRRTTDLSPDKYDSKVELCNVHTYVKYVVEHVTCIYHQGRC